MKFILEVPKWKIVRYENCSTVTLSLIFLFSANFLEIDVCKPFTHTDENGKRYTDYEIHMRTNLPVFAIKEFTVRRRYSDFVWLRKEIERTVKIYIPGIFRCFIEMKFNGLNSSITL